MSAKMREYVVSLRRGADMKVVVPSGSLTDAVKETRVHIMEVMPTGKTVVVAVSSPRELELLRARLDRTCHVVERTIGHVLNGSTSAGR
jgi:hypothetical protein